MLCCTQINVKKTRGRGNPNIRPNTFDPRMTSGFFLTFSSRDGICLGFCFFLQFSCALCVVSRGSQRNSALKITSKAITKVVCPEQQYAICLHWSISLIELPCKVKRLRNSLVRSRHRGWRKRTVLVTNAHGKTPSKTSSCEHRSQTPRLRPAALSHKPMLSRKVTIQPVSRRHVHDSVNASNASMKTQ